MKTFILKGLISGGYVGYFPVIRGTIGSLFAVSIYLLLFTLIEIPFKEYIISGGGVIIFTLICLRLGKWAENYYKQKDPQCFVLDEMAGYFLSVFMLDISQAPFLIVIFTFITFRVFDIVKPFPARRLQRLPAGLGIVIDDLIAGIYTNILARLVICFIKLDPSSYIL